MNELTESALIEKLKKRDDQSFSWLVDNYQHKVINICYRFFLNKEDAEDIAQLVFIEIYQSIHKFKGESTLSTWIYRIAVSKCLDDLKRKKRKKRFSSGGKPVSIDWAEEISVLGGRPDEKMESKEAFQKLLNALGQLPENQRTALALSKIDGYQNQQIAEIMNMSISAIDSLIYRAKKNLQSDIDQQNDQ